MKKTLTLLALLSLVSLSLTQSANAFDTRGNGGHELFGAAVYISFYGTTTAVLLKEVKAAEPDALEHIAGGSASPLLYSTVRKLQDSVYEETGEVLSFDQAVNEIILAAQE